MNCPFCNQRDVGEAAVCPRCKWPLIVGAVPAPEPAPDPLPALADAFEDYARLAQDAGHWATADVWQRAADIARGFVPRA